jgi:hypothetical protein
VKEKLGSVGRLHLVSEWKDGKERMTHEWCESSRRPVLTGDVGASETSGEYGPNAARGEGRLERVRKMRE